MRSALGTLLVLATLTAPALVGAQSPPSAPPTSGHLLLHWHPRAWQPPTAAAGMRAELDPVTGEWVAPTGPAPATFGRTRAQALAEVRVQTRPDGSRFAVLGDRGRVYTVAHVEADGSIRRECAPSEAQALERIQPVPPATREAR